MASYKRCSSAVGTVSGWGRKNPDIPDVSNILQRVDLRFVDYQKCLEIYPEYFIDGMICAGPSEGGKSRKDLLQDFFLLE